MSSISEIRPGASGQQRATTDGENDALQAIAHARAIADTIYNGTAHKDSSFIEELGNSSLNSLAHVLIEKLDHASKLIEQVALALDDAEFGSRAAVLARRTE